MAFRDVAFIRIQEHALLQRVRPAS